MTAKFFYYPAPGNRLVEIDIGENLGELFSDYSVTVNDGISLDGAIHRSVGRINEIVTIQRDRLALGEDLVVKLQTMQSHLQRGGSVSFTSDHLKAWSYPVILTPNSGSNSVKVGANPFSASMGSIIPEIDDYCVIESSNPGSVYEYGKISAVSVTASSGGSISIADKVNYEYSRASFIRWYRCWPVLRLPSSQVNRSIVTNEHGVTFSLDVTLVSDLSGLMQFHPGSIVDSVAGNRLIQAESSGIDYGRPDVSGVGNFSSVPEYEQIARRSHYAPEFD